MILLITKCKYNYIIMKNIGIFGSCQLYYPSFFFNKKLIEDNNLKNQASSIKIINYCKNQNSKIQIIKI
jgi:hypothetical protein